MSGFSSQTPNWGPQPNQGTPAQIQALNDELEHHRRMAALEKGMQSVSMKRGGRGKKSRRRNKSRRHNKSKKSRKTKRIR